MSSEDLLQRGGARGVLVAALLATALAPSSPRAASPAEQYRRLCSSCHDGGVAHAPRIGHAEDWAGRLRAGKAALYETALRGKPDTAMLPKGGYTQLSDAEVKAIVDHMLSTLPAGLADSESQPARSEPSAAVSGGAGHEVSDDELLAAIRAALDARRGLPSQAIRVKVAGRVATLEGVLDNAQQVRLAEDLVRQVKGVQRVESKLISSALFEFD